MEITSLLFDLNYKFELIGASLLALAKSIYYGYPCDIADSKRPSGAQYYLSLLSSGISRALVENSLSLCGTRGLS